MDVACNLSLFYLNAYMLFTKMIRARVMQCGQLAYTLFELCGRHAGVVVCALGGLTLSVSPQSVYT